MTVPRQTRQLEEGLSWLSQYVASLPVCTEQSLEGNNLNEDMIFLFPFKAPTNFSSLCFLPCNFPPDLLMTHIFPPSNLSATVTFLAALSGCCRSREHTRDTDFHRLDLSWHKEECWGSRGLFTFVNEKTKVGASKCQHLSFAGWVAGWESKSLLTSGQVLGNTPYQMMKPNRQIRQTPQQKAKVSSCFC